ncbi:MAG: ATP-dependent HslUV protease subunit HslV [Glaciecola sp.]|jgi:ATP-dependent HslUV protease subunit HslV
MTTIIVAKKSGRAVICADTLASYGGSHETSAYIENSDKILQIGGAFLGPTGPASMQLVLTSYFRNPTVTRNFSDPLSIFETVREMHGVLKEDYALNPREDPEDPFESSQTEMLVCSASGIFGVYPLRSVQEYKRFYAFGSGAEYAMGAMHAVFEYLDRPEDIAIAGLEAAATFDEASGLPYTLHSLDLNPKATRTQANGARRTFDS